MPKYLFPFIAFAILVIGCGEDPAKAVKRRTISAANQQVTTKEDKPVTAELATTISPATADLPELVLDSEAKNGTVTLYRNAFTYTPATNFQGEDTFTIHAELGSAQSNVVTVTVTVTPVNDAPVAKPLSITAIENGVGTGTVTGTDIEGDALTFQVMVAPSHGTVSMAPGGAFTYTPTVGYAGSDAFEFRANDGSAKSDNEEVSITVTPSNDAPLAYPSAFTTDEDTDLDANLTATDPDGNALFYAVSDQPDHGVLVVDPLDGSFTYTPALNYSGPDAFSFTADDGASTTAAAIVTLTVTAVNDAPFVYAQAVALVEDTNYAGTVTGADIEASTLSFRIQTYPAHGTAGVTVSGDIDYSPVADYAGADTFTVVANDGDLESAPATISVTVTPVQDAPVAYATTMTVGVNQVLANMMLAVDPDGDALTYSVTVTPGTGTFFYNATEGTFEFTPFVDYVGTVTFQFKASDATVASNTAVFTIEVNAAPVAGSTPLTVDEDTIAAGTITATDAEDDPLYFTIVTLPSNGSVTWVTDTGDFKYRPAQDYNGGDTFTVAVTDGYSTAFTSVTITMDPVNDAPILTGQSLATELNMPVIGQIQASDAEGDTLTFGKDNFFPLHGTAAIDTATGEFTYYPALNYEGPDFIPFKVDDGVVTRWIHYPIQVGSCEDQDGDGFGPGCFAGTDCDDTDATVYPGAPEIPDDTVQACGGTEMTVNEENGIFVDAVNGNDAYAGTKVLPVKTFAKAVTMAEDADKAVFLAEGTYVDDNIYTNVSIFGGYQAGTWNRDPALYPSIITHDSEEWTVIGYYPGVTAAIDGVRIFGSCEGTAIFGEGATLTITNSKLIGASMGCDNAWAIFLEDSDSRAVIAGNTIYGGSALTYVNAVATYGRTVLRNNDISLGAADWGEGISIYDGLAVIDGNTIHGGSGSGVATIFGDQHTFTFLTNNVIRGGTGTAGPGWGGTYVLSFETDSYSEISGNIVDAGIASDGTIGLDMDFAYAKLTGNRINAGSGTDYAWGVLVDNNATLQLYGNTFSSTTQTDTIVLVQVINSNVEAVGNIFDLGPAGTFGYGYYGEAVRFAGLFNNTFSQSASTGPAITYGIFADRGVTQIGNNIVVDGTRAIGLSAGQTMLANNDLFGATALVFDDIENDYYASIADVNACFYQGCAGAQLNISASPMFVDGGFQLSDGSACIDAGLDPLLVNPDWSIFVDIIGNPRPSGLAWDIGAYEFVFGL